MTERRRILLIEDDPRDRDRVAAYLERTDYALQGAGGGGGARGLGLAPRRAGEVGDRRPAGKCPGGRGAGAPKDDLCEGRGVTRSLGSLPRSGSAGQQEDSHRADV